MKIATGNDLASGDVVWWTGGGWSRHVAEAIDVGDTGDAIVAREEAAQRVNTGYVTDAEMGATGPMPLNIKQRIRAIGPSVHPQFAVLRDAVSTSSTAPHDERIFSRPVHAEEGLSPVEVPSRSTSDAI